MNTIITFLYYSVRACTPLIFGTAGEILTEKSGSLNLGVEGMMAMGAIGGYYFACLTNSILIGILASFISAGLAALLFAFLTVTLQANQNVTGLSLTIFGVGMYQFFGRLLTVNGSFPQLNDNPHIKWAVSDNGIPFLRDIPYIGQLLFSYNFFVYLAIAIAIILWIYLMRTTKGLKLRAIGENPAAADACGINVSLYKYLNITIGGGICGIGGLYLGVVTNSGAWNENWINGMGWIAVSLVIFANWNPILSIFGGAFFGMFNALRAWKGNLENAFPQIFGWLNAIPNEFYQMLPFAITAVVLIISSIKGKNKSAQPSAIGVNYFREER